VWFVKQGSLPCVEPNEEHTILLESPWKLAVAPTGNGGLFSALHSQNIVDRLSEEGVNYVQVCRICKWMHSWNFLLTKQFSLFVHSVFPWPYFYAHSVLLLRILTTTLFNNSLSEGSQLTLFYIIRNCLLNCGQSTTIDPFPKRSL